jgi:hypothetical protein
LKELAAEAHEHHINPLDKGWMASILPVSVRIDSAAAEGWARGGVFVLDFGNTDRSPQRADPAASELDSSSLGRAPCSIASLFGSLFDK